MALRTPELVLCDLDGTLVDSVPDLADAVDLMLTQLGLPPRGEAAVRRWVGNGAARLVKRALLNQLDGEPDATLFQQALPLFTKAYENFNGLRSQLFPGVREGLAWLKTQNFALGCITNKPAQFTQPLLDSFGIGDYFQLVVSGDTLPKQKPDPLPLIYCAEFFKIKPQQSLMIGDSINDVKAARAAGFQIVCVPYGYNHGDDIYMAEPDAVIESLAALPTVLEH